MSRGLQSLNYPPMGRHHAADEYEDDPNEPDESDMDDDEGDEFGETIECPHCGREVYESAEQCPRCGRYISGEDAPRRGHPWWVVTTAIVLIALMAYGAARWWF